MEGSCRAGLSHRAGLCASFLGARWAGGAVEGVYTGAGQAPSVLQQEGSWVEMGLLVGMARGQETAHLQRGEMGRLKIEWGKGGERGDTGTASPSEEMVEERYRQQQ